MWREIVLADACLGRLMTYKERIRASSQDQVMFARCANPECNREFRELSKGRLFLLPPVHPFPESMGKADRLIEHCYWLCPRCAAIYTATREGNRVVVVRVKPEATTAVA